MATDRLSNLFAGKPATLMLEDGTLFAGRSVGADGTKTAEIVLNTAMTGYQEILTDPSYLGQFITFTAPHIGNYGVTPIDAESTSQWASGIIVKSMARFYSNHRASGSLPDFLVKHGTLAIDSIDTRELVRHIREAGAMQAVLSTEYHTAKELAPFIAKADSMAGANLVDQVSTATITTEAGFDREGNELADGEGYNVIVIDFGAKANIGKLLRNVGCNVITVPHTTSFAEIMTYQPDGVLLSNGPGDPSAVAHGITLALQCLDADIPTFGICLGHQLLAHAIGATTYKMHHGHHGANHPIRNLVKDHVAAHGADEGTFVSNFVRDDLAVEITSQNHGFAVDAQTLPVSGPYAALQSHVNLTDGTNAGICLVNKPAFSVQYHPEAAPGPHDSHYLFDQFISLMAECTKEAN